MPKKKKEEEDVELNVPTSRIASGVNQMAKLEVELRKALQTTQKLKSVFQEAYNKRIEGA